MNIIMQYDQFKVGDIVTYHGRTGFVEEIIIDCKPDNRIPVWRSGKFSIYSLDKDAYIKGDKFYIGDCMGETLEKTGETMTVERLDAYINLVPKNLGVKKDFEIVKNNLGRTSGRNE